MAGLLSSLVSAAVSSAVKSASEKQSTASSSASKKSTASSGTASGGASSAAGVSSGYDKALLSDADRKAVEQYSAAAKAASVAGDQAAVKAAHDAAEAIRAQYGYSGGQLGNEYIPLKKEPVVEKVPGVDTSAMRELMQQQTQAAAEQQSNQIRYTTEQGVAALEHAQDVTEAQLQVMRDQTDLDERKALDNQALYAEVRGDRGGVGRAQYGEVESAAARNRLAVNRQQVQLAAETAYQIQQLRAQGEFQKADALLSLSQSYLGQLVSLEKWAAEYDLSTAKFQAELDHWQQNYLLQVGQLTGVYNGASTLAAQKQQAELEQNRQKTLASAGSALLKEGILPSAAQLAAMGMTAEQARAQIAAQEAAAKAKTTAKSSAGKSTAAAAEKTQDYDGLFRSAREGVDAKSYIANNYKRFGFTSSSGLWDAYQAWLAKQTDDKLLMLDREPEEGQFLWNGKRYDDLQVLLRDIRKTDMTQTEREILREKFKAYDLDVLL